MNIPNAFTPNNDGINDFFFLQSEGVVSFQFRIFDRWGRQLASLSSPTESWDGRNSNGQDLPMGVYVYEVRATFNNGKRLERAGTITLIR